MREDDRYYSCFEQLMKTSPKKLTEDAPEYRVLSERYPYLSEYVRLEKEAERLSRELETARDWPTRRKIGRELENIASRLGRQGILMRLHGEDKLLRHFKTRLITTTVKRRISSWVLNTQITVRSHILNFGNRLRKRLREQSRRARYRRASILPPSLLEMRSLDPLDRTLAIKDWIEKRKVTVQR